MIIGKFCGCGRVYFARKRIRKEKTPFEGERTKEETAGGRQASASVKKKCIKVLLGEKA